MLTTQGPDSLADIRASFADSEPHEVTAVVGTPSKPCDHKTGDCSWPCPRGEWVADL